MHGGAALVDGSRAMALTLAAFTDWLPAAVTWAQQRPQLHWLYAPGLALQKPFYDQTLRSVMLHPFNLLGRRATWLDEFDDNDTAASARPAAFIFHWSRCGSTLIGRMLNAHPDCQLYAEPAPVESILHADVRHGVAQEPWLLRRLINAMCLPRTGGERHTFIKFAPWGITALPLVRRAFPEVPCLFVYRDPVEILVSHQRSPGMHMLPPALPPALFGMTLEQAVQMPLLAYRVEVLRTLAAHAAEYARRGWVEPVNYTQLPEYVTTLCARWGVAQDDATWAVSRQAAVRNSKNPQAAFVSDGEAKQGEASAALRRAAEAVLMPLHDELERLRR